MVTYEKVTATFNYESEASGIVSASSWAGQGQLYGNNYKPWYAFNGQWGYDQKTWATTNNLPQWIQYKFPSPVCVRRVITVNRNEDDTSAKNNRAASAFTLQGSNDGSTWTNIQDCSIAQSTGHYKETIDINNKNEYLYYRLYVTNNFNGATGTGCGFAEVEMYKGIEKPSNYIPIYSDGNIINGNSIIDTNFTPEQAFRPSGTPAVQNTGGYLDFVAYPNVQTWANSYIRTGIKVQAGDEMVFHVEESLTNYADTKYTITAQTSGEICIMFDNANWDNVDPRNHINMVWVNIGIPTGTKSGAANGTEIGGNYDYAAGVQRPIDKIRSIYFEGLSKAGDIEAIRDWTQSTRYVKDDIDYFFMRMVNDGLTAYDTTFRGMPNDLVTLEGLSSGEIYEVQLDEGGKARKLLFFDEGESVDVDMMTGTQTYSLVSKHREITTECDNTIPAMTSATTPSGQVTTTSQYDSNHAGYMAFDRQSCDMTYLDGAWIASANDSTPCITYDYGKNVFGNTLRLDLVNNGPTVDRELFVEGSLNGTDWFNILENGESVTKTFTQNTRETYYVELNWSKMRYVRIRGVEPFYGGSWQYACAFDTIQVIGAYEVKPYSYIFKDGVLNTSICNGLTFIKQNNGTNNESAITTDGYIHLSKTATTNGDSFIYSHDKINLDNYSKLIVKFKLVSDHSDSNYKFRVRFDNSQTNQAHVNYHSWNSSTFTASNDIQTYELDLSTVTTIRNAYLCLGGVQDVYIYQIGLAD